MVLAVFVIVTAVVAGLAFRKQSREVSDQGEMLKLQRQELDAQREDSAKQAVSYARVFSHYIAEPVPRPGLGAGRSSAGTRSAQGDVSQLGRGHGARSARLLAVGFGLYLVSTVAATIEQDIAGIAPPFPWVSIPVLFGTIGGAPGYGPFDKIIVAVTS